MELVTRVKKDVVVVGSKNRSVNTKTEEKKKERKNKLIDRIGRQREDKKKERERENKLGKRKREKKAAAKRTTDMLFIFGLRKS